MINCNVLEKEIYTNWSIALIRMIFVLNYMLSFSIEQSDHGMKAVSIWFWRLIKESR